MQAEGSNQGDGAAFCAIAADARDAEWESSHFRMKSELICFEVCSSKSLPGPCFPPSGCTHRIVKVGEEL